MKKIFNSKKWLLFSLSFALLMCAVILSMNKVDANKSSHLKILRENNQFVLNTEELGSFHRTPQAVSDARLINLPDSDAIVLTWNEQKANGTKAAFYAISLEGKTIQKIQETSYEMMLRYGKFDPLETVPATPNNLTARTSSNGENAYIVQFTTQPLEQYVSAVKALGGKTYIYLPNHAHIVMMNEQTRRSVENLPFVRWVGDYQPAYKLEEELLDGLNRNTLQSSARYNVMVLERGQRMQNKVSQFIQSKGGKIELTIPEGFRMEVTLSPEQLLALAGENEVLFIDRWSAPESDMNIVREVGGANFIENTLGFKGEGVRAEVMDAGFLTTHTDFNSGLTPILHGSVNVDSHGTATYGIIFGRGTTNPAGRGMMPEAQGIMAGYTSLTNRYTHTARLLQDPYKAVFQSNSWGSALTTQYTTISAEMDDILFINDFLLLNSQSNTGNQNSRPQAWSKNVVSIGGITHQNTATLVDDRWTSASVGPASDGRLKPDLAHFYDNIFTTTSSSPTAYTSTFNGTSAATPITAGHFGIFYQMWHNGLFGNQTGATVFDSRPRMTTAKAIMINTAVQWDMTIAGTNTTRARQGFGRADLTNLYNLRDKMLVVNEEDVLQNLQSKTYTVTVPANSTNPLKVTMVYADPMGSPSATRARINDLSLKVTAPNGTIYWGNNGLNAGMWSTSGGSANVVDTVENVFVQTPAAGTWTIEVIASELVQDARPETPGVIDADFALVASGIEVQASRTQFDFDGDGKADISVFRPSNGTWYLNRSSSGMSGMAFGIQEDKIVPADYDGDGKTDIAVYRNGIWYLQRSTAGFIGLAFGTAEDIPVPADYDGDGKAEIAVFRPSNGTWYFYNLVTNQASGFAFGQSGDKPVVGDYDGDGKADIAVFRPSNGFWYMQKSSGGYGEAAFGQATDIPVPADYNGDGKTNLAVFRPSNGTWYIARPTGIPAQNFDATLFGIATDKPVPADYDGDGKADIAVFREGTWYLMRSQAGFTGAVFGTATDKAIPNSFVR